MIHATLCFLLNGNPPDEVLLGLKKTGFGQGKWGGFGGKVEAGETVEAAESVEMLPAWFKLEQIPYDQMWDDSRYWLPLILDGERVNARFTFKDDNETVDSVEMKER